MVERSPAPDWIGQRVDDVYGSRLGRVEDVYVDQRSGEPVWLLVRAGRFGDEHIPLPVSEAAPGGGGVWVPYERQAVKSAPRVTPGAPLTRERELVLAAHYGVRAAREQATRGLPAEGITCVPSLADDGEPARR